MSSPTSFKPLHQLTNLQIVCDRLKKGASLTGKPSRSGERDEGKEEGKAPSGPTEASGGRGEEKGEEKGS